MPEPNRYVETDAKFLRRMYNLLESVDWVNDEEDRPNNDDLNRLDSIANRLKGGEET